MVHYAKILLRIEREACAAKYLKKTDKPEYERLAGWTRTGALLKGLYQENYAFDFHAVFTECRSIQ